MALELVWDSELIFHAAGGHALTTDSEGQAGYSPTQLLAEAVMGCMAMDVVHILKKGRHDLRGLRVTFAGQRAETYPKRYTKIHLTFHVTGPVPREAVDRAIELSHSTYCSVSNSLAKDLEFTTSVELSA
jgi:putative redox protein